MPTSHELREQLANSIDRSKKWRRAENAGLGGSAVLEVYGFAEANATQGTSLWAALGGAALAAGIIVSKVCRFMRQENVESQIADIAREEKLSRNLPDFEPEYNLYDAIERLRLDSRKYSGQSLNLAAKDSLVTHYNYWQNVDERIGIVGMTLFALKEKARPVDSIAPTNLMVYKFALATTLDQYLPIDQNDVLTPVNTKTGVKDWESYLGMLQANAERQHELADAIGYPRQLLPN